MRVLGGRTGVDTGCDGGEGESLDPYPRGRTRVGGGGVRIRRHLPQSPAGLYPCDNTVYTITEQLYIYDTLIRLKIHF